MKSFYSLFILLLVLICSGTVFSQSIETGKNLYQNGDYERAIRVFSLIDEPESNLFTGKSYFALGDYKKANAFEPYEESGAEIYVAGWESGFDSFLKEFFTCRFIK